MKETSKKSFTVSLICKKHGGLVVAEKIGAGSAFHCPGCNLKLLYLADQHKLGAHGKSEKTLEHELRSAKEA